MQDVMKFGLIITTDAYVEADDVYDGYYTLECMYLDSLDFDRMHALSLDLSRKARAHAGIYDGWYTSVQTQ